MSSSAACVRCSEPLTSKEDGSPQINLNADAQARVQPSHQWTRTSHGRHAQTSKLALWRSQAWQFVLRTERVLCHETWTSARVQSCARSTSYTIPRLFRSMPGLKYYITKHLARGRTPRSGRVPEFQSPTAAACCTQPLWKICRRNRQSDHTLISRINKMKPMRRALMQMVQHPSQPLQRPVPSADAKTQAAHHRRVGRMPGVRTSPGAIGAC